MVFSGQSTEDTVQKQDLEWTSISSHTVSIAVYQHFLKFVSLHLWTASLSLIFQWKAAQNSKVKSQIIRTVFFQFHITIYLEFTAGHSKKCTNIIPVHISPKNLSGFSSVTKYTCFRPFNLSFLSFSFLIGVQVYGPNYLKCWNLCAGPAASSFPPCSSRSSVSDSLSCCLYASDSGESL